MLNTELLSNKINDLNFQNMIINYSRHFSAAETDLLNDILTNHQFDIVQAQALAQAVLQQSRFDPNADHLAGEWDDDDETTAICPHCLNPPVPPLRDYAMWREKAV